MKRWMLIGFLCCWQSLCFATVTLQLDSPQVTLGETFSLTLTIEDAQSNLIPDLTPLQQNFSIVSTARSMSYSLFNGQTHSVSQWTLLLMAKHKGNLIIPPIQVGQEKTIASSIEVLEDAGTSIQPASESKEVLLTTEVSEKEPYVNQEVIYTVKLYNSHRLLNADYQPPEVGDGLLIPLGGGRRYQTSVNGRMYAVEEQRYAIFPQKSGRLKITPPTFNALLYGAVPQQVTVKGDAVALQVKPSPTTNTSSYWLPAKQILLSESYDKTTSSVMQGSTLVRTITLEGVAVPAQLLPTLEFGKTKQWSVYPQKPAEKNTIKQEELVGTRIIRVTYLFNKAGQTTIPALKLPWFNTVTGQEEISSLPALTLDVLATSSTPQTSQSAPTAYNPSKQIDRQPERKEKQVFELNTKWSKAWWVAGGFAIAWLLTIMLWYVQRRHNSLRQRRQEAWRLLQEACLANKPALARDALLNWARLQWPNAMVLNLSDLDNLMPDLLLKQQIQLLSQALYKVNAAQSSIWQGELLWRSLAATSKRSMKKNKADPLPPINP